MKTKIEKNQFDLTKTENLNNISKPLFNLSIINMIFNFNYIISKGQEKCNIKNKNKNKSISSKTILNTNKIFSFMKNLMIFYFINSILLVSSLDSSYTEVIITIEGTAEQQILSEDFGIIPDQVYINNVLQDDASLMVDITGNYVNNITIKWNYLLTSCRRMFSDLTSITNIYFTNFDTSNVTDLSYMFNGCTSLTSLDLNTFNTSRVTNMRAMFYECELLSSIMLDNFDTSNAIDISSMFYGCSLLTSLNLNHFDTSRVTEIKAMFQDCGSLSSLNIDNFDTSKASSFNYMFKGCSSLTSLDLTSFNTEKVTSMKGMFEECNLLTSLNLNSFNTSIVTNFDKMFYECNSLVSLNLNNFDMTQLETVVNNFFYNINNNLIICINVDKTSNANYDGIKINCTEICYEGDYFYCMEYECPDKYSKLINGKKICIKSCENDIYYRYEYKNTCYKECPENTKNNNYICETIYDASTVVEIDAQISSELTYKTQITEDYYISDSIVSIPQTNVIDFTTEKYDGYVITDSIYNSHLVVDTTEIFYTSDLYKENSISTDIDKEQNEYTNSLSDSKDVKYEYSISDTKEVGYEYSLSDSKEIEYKNNLGDSEEGKYEYSLSDSEEVNNLNSDDITEDNDIIAYLKEIIKKKLLEKSIYIELEGNNNYNYDDNIKDEIIKIIREILRSLEIDKIKKIISIIKREGEYSMFEDETISIALTISENENENNNKNNNKNETTINLKECETKLKKEYTIPSDESLLLFKIDISKEDIRIPIVEYEVYYPLNGKNLENLDLSKCEDIKIDITLPIILNKDDIDKHNPNSGYYKDICYKSTTSFGTDITFQDRKKEYSEKKLYVCEDNCIFVEYNSTNERVLCSCDVKKTFFDKIADININTTRLLNSIVDIKNIINLNVVKCYDNLFQKDGIKNDIGFWLNSPVALFHIITIILFYTKEKITIIKIIQDINYAKKSQVKEKGKISNKTIDTVKTDYKKNKNKKVNKKKKKEKKNHSPPIKKQEKKAKKKKSSNRTINVIHTSSNSTSVINNYYILNNKSNTKINYIPENKGKNNDKKIELILAYNNNELNNLPYNDALKFDKRNYFQYYLSLLKTNHLLISTFYPVNDYNSRIIKIFLFFFLFIVYFFVNALFFNDSTMHKIYKDEGTFDFIYQLPQIIYSSLISVALNTLIKFLALNEKDILKIKRLKNNQLLEKKIEDIKKTIFYKFVAFFFVSFAFLYFFWYYLSCFCNVYENTQIHVIKDTAISFGLSLFYSFLLCLLPGIFRSISLQNKNNKFMYKFSQILQNV